MASGQCTIRSGVQPWASFLILGNRELVKAWKNGRISFSPEIEKSQIGISSIDLRLGYEVSKLLPKEGHVINPTLDNFDPTGLFISDNFKKPDHLGKLRTLKIEPKDFMVAFTYESVHIPQNLAASVEGRSRLARYGLAVHTTAPHIDPAFVGQIALELFNHGPIALELRPGIERVCHLIFHEVRSPVSEKVAHSMGTFLKQKRPYQKPRSKSSDDS
jgi:dCTP deaminase